MIDYNDLSEEELIKIVNSWASNIQFIKNPSETVQLAAINKWSYSIQHIKNPSEAAQIKAIRYTPYAIGLIKKPSEKVQIEAVKSLNYNRIDNSDFICDYITSANAKELYNQLKKIYNII